MKTSHKNLISKHRSNRVIEGRATFFIITAGAVHHRMLPPACSMKALCWNKSGYAKPNIPCWYQMGSRNVLHSMAKAKRSRLRQREGRQGDNIKKRRRKQGCGWSIFQQHGSTHEETGCQSTQLSQMRKSLTPF